VPIIGPVMPGRPEYMFESLSPIRSIDPVLGPQMRQAHATVPPLQPVSQQMLERLVTVIAQAGAGNGSSVADIFKNVVVRGRLVSGASPVTAMTIRQFMALSPEDQLAVIDIGWNRVCTKKAYDKATYDMFEPAAPAIAPTVSPIPSGMIPDGAGGYRVGYVNRAGVPDAFKDLKVGFRVDGSDDNIPRTIQRINDDGMTTQLKNRYLMYNIKGWEVEGTTVDLDTLAPRVWATKNDLFNESAVCVARNFFGATAFPMRDMVGRALLWAVDVTGLIGFDTEQYQTTLGADRQWRPGEKAYMRIPPSNVIAYVPIRKLGEPVGGRGGWSFSIERDAQWTWGRHRALPAQRTYIEAMLDAWKGTHTIPGAYDFAT
jgi:hypothetical protein